VPSRDVTGRLLKRASRLNLFIAEPVAAQLAAYYELLSGWNKKINLTSIRDLDDGIDRLLLEPIAAARHVPAGVRSIIDIGSGGGSPAIPFKLALPAARLTMVEVKARKSAFLREAVRRLELSNAQVETARYEELLTRPELHEANDVVSIRAVRIETRVLTTLQAFLAPGGSLVMFRGPEGPPVPSTIVPPLEFAGTYPLIDSLQSRLTVLTKRRIR
jgi:16S rRNA (guanine527-N7)-methyltransferase